MPIPVYISNLPCKSWSCIILCITLYIYTCSYIYPTNVSIIQLTTTMYIHCISSYIYPTNWVNYYVITPPFTLQMWVLHHNFYVLTSYNVHVYMYIPCKCGSARYYLAIMLFSSYIYPTNVGLDMPSYVDYKYGVEYLFINLLSKSKFRTMVRVNCSVLFLFFFSPSFFPFSFLRDVSFSFSLFSLPLILSYLSFSFFICRFSLTPFSSNPLSSFLIPKCISCNTCTYLFYTYN